jgi:ABC-type branched-subunit amino acid transport system permease subunit
MMEMTYIDFMLVKLAVLAIAAFIAGFIGILPKDPPEG